MKYVCNVCGSDDIEIRAWINPNTDEVVGDIDENGECWCNNCAEHTRVDELNDTDYGKGI